MEQLPGKGDHAVPHHSVQQSLSEWLCLPLTFQNNYREDIEVGVGDIEIGDIEVGVISYSDQALQVITAGHG